MYNIKIMTNETKKGIVKSVLDKVKLVDAGVKDKYGMLSSPVKSDSSPKIYYPHLSLDSKEAPMLTGCETGEYVDLLIHACVVSHSLDESKDRKNERFTLEIEKIGIVTTTKSKN
jgi:hypothetical protein